jgi:hypothetical protein
MFRGRFSERPAPLSIDSLADAVTIPSMAVDDAVEPGSHPADRGMSAWSFSRLPPDSLATAGPSSSPMMMRASEPPMKLRRLLLLLRDPDVAEEGAGGHPGRPKGHRAIGP